jgi:hypothetical protein
VLVGHLLAQLAEKGVGQRMDKAALSNGKYLALDLQVGNGHEANVRPIIGGDASAHHGCSQARGHQRQRGVDLLGLVSAWTLAPACSKMLSTCREKCALATFG